MGTPSIGNQQTLDDRVLEHSRYWHMAGLYLRCSACGMGQKASEAQCSLCAMPSAGQRVVEIPSRDTSRPTF